ncbi:MAG: type VI secretion system protein TssA [Desulfosarcina sp.]|nr:type VI secretion system protein TssA [Desulfosarcina sp.]
MIDLEVILNPIEGDNPAGENLRYDPTYDAIQEARREDDLLDRGDWDREIKTAEWNEVAALAEEALTNRTKDLQIAAWLLEALIKTEGFHGLKDGLNLINGLMENFWDHLYPEIEDDDLDFRIGPLEYMNAKLWLPIKEIPLTDTSTTPGYSWVKWQDSIQVGSDADSLDSAKKQDREEMIADGKPTVEEFESAVVKSSKAFYVELNDLVVECTEAFNRFDNLLDEKFGKDAPRTADLQQAIEEYERFVKKTLKQKRELEPDPEPEDDADTDNAGIEDTGGELDEGDIASETPVSALPAQGQVLLGKVSDNESQETAVWNSALTVQKNHGLKKALDTLFAASCSASSIRARNRYRLLMAKLCLRTNRPDLARPIAEELNTLIEEIGLDRWESPVWIAEVLGALYQCLIQSEAGGDDANRAEELFKKMCTIDLTKALSYRQS